MLIMLYILPQFARHILQHSYYALISTVVCFGLCLALSFGLCLDLSFGLCLALSFGFWFSLCPCFSSEFSNHLFCHVSSLFSFLQIHLQLPATWQVTCCDVLLQYRKEHILYVWWSKLYFNFIKRNILKVSATYLVKWCGMILLISNAH